MTDNFEYLTINETNALLKTIAEPRDHAIITLFLTTGLFVNELITLTAADIDFENKRLLITGKRTREIPLNDQAYESLAKWTKSRIETPVPNFFLTAKGKPQKLSIGTIDKLIRKHAKLAGFKRKINAKILRNTFGINLFTQDISVTKASNILGITDPDSIKRYIQAAKTTSTEKPTTADIQHTDTRPILQKSISKIFPTKPQVVKAETKLKAQITANPEELIFGRETLLSDLTPMLDKNQSLLLTGKPGVGFTHLLKYLATTRTNTFFIPNPTPTKQMLTDICQKMDLDWKSSLGARATLTDILNYLKTNAVTSDLPMLVIDNLQKLKLSDQEIIVSLLDQFTILGATNNLNPKLNKLWWKFKAVDLPALSTDASKTLIKYLTQNLSISDYELMETKIMNLANGLPSAITDIIKQLSYCNVINRAAVQSIYHEAGVVYRDWTPLVIVAWGLVVMFRFIALGTHSFEGYVIAGIGTSVLLVARFFVMKLR